MAVFAALRLRSSPPQSGPLPGTARRSGQQRWFYEGRHHGCSKGGLGQAGARLCGAEERRSHGRAQSAHPHLTCRSLFERSRPKGAK